MALIFHYKCTLKCRMQFVSIWTSLKFCRLVMGYSNLHVFLLVDTSNQLDQLHFVYNNHIVYQLKCVLMEDCQTCSVQEENGFFRTVKWQLPAKNRTV